MRHHKLIRSLIRRIRVLQSTLESRDLEDERRIARETLRKRRQAEDDFEAEQVSARHQYERQQALRDLEQARRREDESGQRRALDRLRVWS